MAEELLQELRYFTMLLTLLTEATNDHPKLHNPLFTASRNHVQARTTDSESVRSRQLDILRDFSICCIKNRDIIAAASGYSKPAEPRTLPGVMLCRDNRHSHFDRFQDLSNFPDFTRIILINNPDTTDRFFSSLDSKQEICNIGGQSYWLSITDDSPWTFVATNPRRVAATISSTNATHDLMKDPARPKSRCNSCRIFECMYEQSGYESYIF
jgi:hypothetical protein